MNMVHYMYVGVFIAMPSVRPYIKIVPCHLIMRLRLVCIIMWLIPKIFTWKNHLEFGSWQHKDLLLIHSLEASLYNPATFCPTTFLVTGGLTSLWALMPVRWLVGWLKGWKIHFQAPIEALLARNTILLLLFTAIERHSIYPVFLLYSLYSITHRKKTWEISV